MNHILRLLQALYNTQGTSDKFKAATMPRNPASTREFKGGVVKIRFLESSLSCTEKRQKTVKANYQYIFYGSIYLSDNSTKIDPVGSPRRPELRTLNAALLQPVSIPDPPHLLTYDGTLEVELNGRSCIIS